MKTEEDFGNIIGAWVTISCEEMEDLYRLHQKGVDINDCEEIASLYVKRDRVTGEIDDAYTRLSNKITSNQ